MTDPRSTDERIEPAVKAWYAHDPQVHPNERMARALAAADAVDPARNGSDYAQQLIGERDEAERRLSAARTQLADAQAELKHAQSNIRYWADMHRAEYEGRGHDIADYRRAESALAACRAREAAIRQLVMRDVNRHGGGIGMALEAWVNAKALLAVLGDETGTDKADECALCGGVGVVLGAEEKDGNT